MAKLPQLRKATMKKNTPYKFGKRLSKGDNVLIQEKLMSRGRVYYTAVKPDDNSIMATNVTRSMFEYTEKEKFIVCVTRITYSSRNIEVDAMDRKSAEAEAIDAAGDFEFSEQNADYKSDGVWRKADHENLFN